MPETLELYHYQDYERIIPDQDKENKENVYHVACLKLR